MKAEKKKREEELYKKVRCIVLAVRAFVFGFSCIFQNYYGMIGCCNFCYLRSH